MTAIKQKSVFTKSHAANLRKYLDDERALLHDSQNINDEKNWEQEMHDTREIHNHNKPPKGHEYDKHGNPAKNVIIQHQILAFSPDECDFNLEKIPLELRDKSDGSMTSEKCMQYAKEYAKEYFPGHQIKFALHKEHCEADRTERYAIHMAINRTDLNSWNKQLKTCNRLRITKGEETKKINSSRAKTMDKKWNLKQMVKGVENSKIHKLQPSQQEREMLARTEKLKAEGKPYRYPYKWNLREVAMAAKDESTNLGEWKAKMEEWGAVVEEKNGRIYLTDPDASTEFHFAADRLESSLKPERLAAELANPKHVRKIRLARFEDEVRAEMRQEREVKAAEDAYELRLGKLFRKYEETVAAAKGTDFAYFPKFKIPPRPQAYKTDRINQLVIDYRSKAERLRDRYASDVPVAGRDRPHIGGSSKSGRSQTRAADRSIQSKGGSAR